MDYSSRKIHLEIQLIETLSNFYDVKQLKRQNFSDHYLESVTTIPCGSFPRAHNLTVLDI